MRLTKILVAFAITLLVIGTTFTAAESGSMTQEEMQKKWMAYATPSDGHKYLGYFVGNWKGESKMWMAPNTKPTVMAHDAVSKMIMGGRYLETHMKGDYQGMPFEGRQLTGYDNMKKMYLSHWIDNMGTGFSPTQGSLDKAGKARSESGVWVCPMTGGDLKVRVITKIVDKDKFVMEMHSSGGMHGSKEFKTMEIVYTRAK